MVLGTDPLAGDPGPEFVEELLAQLVSRRAKGLRLEVSRGEHLQDVAYHGAAVIEAEGITARPAEAGFGAHRQGFVERLVEARSDIDRGGAVLTGRHRPAVHGEEATELSAGGAERAHRRFR